MRALTIGAFAVTLIALIITALTFAITYHLVWCVAAGSGIVVYMLL